MGDGPARDLGDDARDVVVAQRLGPGDHQIGTGCGLVGEGAHGDRCDVVGVDEADPARTGRGQDGAVAADAVRVQMVIGEVLHEPRRPQDRPLVEQAGEQAVYLADSGGAWLG
jgi:hypothetical protein